MDPSGMMGLTYELAHDVRGFVRRVTKHFGRQAATSWRIRNLLSDRLTKPMPIVYTAGRANFGSGGEYRRP